jgi:hypothetical protein
MSIAAASSFVLALVLAGPAAAAGAGEKAGQAGMSGEMPKFSDLDMDSDGNVTKQDLKDYTQILDKWDQIDANQDDQIDRAEFAAFETEQAGKESPGMQEGVSPTKPY